MANFTNLGASLGALLAGSVDPTGRLSGELAGGRQVQALSTADFNRARTEEALIDAALKKQRLDFDPYEATRLQMGLAPTIGAQLREYATNPEFVAPEGFDPDLAKNFMRNASSYLYGNTMGERNPTNIGKGQAQFMENDFMGGQGDPMEYARRAAALKGDAKGMIEADALSAVQGGGLTPERLGDQIRTLTLAGGKSLYDFKPEGVGDVVTGNFNMNEIGTAKVGSERALAGQRNAAANLNNANIGLVNAKTVNERNKPASGSSADKPPAGYEWVNDGQQRRLRMIPGGPADQKSLQQDAGRETVSQVINDLKSAYDNLDEGAGIVSDEKDVFSNSIRNLRQSWVGQQFGRGMGTKNQSERDRIEQARPLLLQAIMKATGMSARQIDSNAELKLYLSTATDPQKSYEANMTALERLEKLYGLSGRNQPEPTVQAQSPAPSNQRQVDSIPDPATLPEGARLVDPESGNAMIVRGGKWVKDSRR